MRLLLAAGLCLSLVGCSAISDMATGHGGETIGQRVYGGTRWNAETIEGELMVTHGGFVEKVFGVCDFPFSLALDTAFLPVTIVFAIARWGHTMDR